MTMCANRGAVIAIVDRLIGLADHMGLRPAEMERLIGVHGGVWPFSASRRDLWWPTVEQADRAGALHGILLYLVTAMGRDGARAWLRERNPGLGVAPVRFMLMQGRGLMELRDLLAVEQCPC